MQHNTDQSARGVIFAVSAFTFWGLNPFYFKAIGHIPVAEMLVHRIVWAVALLAVVLIVTGQAGRIRDVLQDRKKLALLALTGTLISFNWLFFMWAIINERLLEVSLGYFINPLFSVLLGVLFLKERLRPLQHVAVLSAAIGVGYFVVEIGALPWVALILPITFGLYGLARKQIDVDPFTGLLTEMTVILPLALAYWIYLVTQQTTHFGPGQLGDSLLLMLAGPVTVIPLILFAAATRRINLSTIGFTQYIAPSMNFVMAVFIFKEAFGSAQLVTFSFIWVSLIIFTIEGVRFTRLGNGQINATTVAE